MNIPIRIHYVAEAHFDCTVEVSEEELEILKGITSVDSSNENIPIAGTTLRKFINANSDFDYMIHDSDIEEFVAEDLKDHPCFGVLKGVHFKYIKI